MKLYSYIIARDFGFAPNPFFGVCTLATCKPVIRQHARVGDWIVGTGSRNYDLEGRLVFAMKVEESCSFDQYWDDPRFAMKKPNLHASLMQAVGDNIYHHGPDGNWLQEDSHHSHPGGLPNTANVEKDTQTDRVLISTTFGYWGKDAIAIPPELDICHTGRGYRVNFPPRTEASFEEWFMALPDMLDADAVGYFGEPAEFQRMLRENS
ncbi:MAG: hypothetical protein LDL44_01865 [Caenispirillum sp.]|nr:hypothetical protein [Caenispirillum sp.]